MGAEYESEGLWRALSRKNLAVFLNMPPGMGRLVGPKPRKKYIYTPIF